ncbi:MAG TPA: response regulator [Verrucomicrobiae bacterium]
MKESPSIMVVEDEGIVARDLSQRLTHLGYRVPAISMTGEDALKQAEAIHPDLVLMDINLRGGIDGVETATRLRQKHNVPVIYLTAYSDSSTLDRAKQTEPYGYLLKPFVEPELHAAIEVALFKHQRELQSETNGPRADKTMDAAPDGVLLLDMEGKITEANSAAENILGATSKDLKGKIFLEKVVSFEWHTWFGHEMEEFAAGRKSQGDTWMEIHALRHDATTFPAEVTMSLVEAKGQRWMVIFMRDISRRRRFEQEVDKLIRSLQSSLANMKTLRGMITICTTCKKIRDDRGDWSTIERYLMSRTPATFSHSYCPDCLAQVRRSLGL